jgi:hypothetical protein
VSDEAKMMFPETRDGIDRDEPCETAEKFMTMLTASSAMWDGDVSQWIFRGQADADWTLVPTLVRSPETLISFGLEGSIPWRNPPRVDVLVELLERFRTALDQSGIIVPSAMPAVVQRGNAIYSSEPDPEAFPLMALAQHHGLPTLFLDWTRLARVGAYFAAAQFGPTTGSGTHLAVWGLRLPRPKGRFDTGSTRLLCRYDAPGSTNPNLHAQSGLFTILHPVPAKLVEPTLDPPPEEYLTLAVERFVHYAATLEPGAYLLRRLTLPKSEAPRLLQLLAHEGVDGAAMFPGVDGVVRAMRERALWERWRPE